MLLVSGNPFMQHEKWGPEGPLKAWRAVKGFCIFRIRGLFPSASSLSLFCPEWVLYRSFQPFGLGFPLPPFLLFFSFFLLSFCLFFFLFSFFFLSFFQAVFHSFLFSCLLFLFSMYFYPFFFLFFISFYISFFLAFCRFSLFSTLFPFFLFFLFCMFSIFLSVLFFPCFLFFSVFSFFPFLSFLSVFVHFFSFFCMSLCLHVFPISFSSFHFVLFVLWFSLFSCICLYLLLLRYHQAVRGACTWEGIATRASPSSEPRCAALGHCILALAIRRTDAGRLHQWVAKCSGSWLPGFPISMSFNAC